MNEILRMVKAIAEMSYHLDGARELKSALRLAGRATLLVTEDFSIVYPAEVKRLAGEIRDAAGAIIEQLTTGSEPD